MGDRQWEGSWRGWDRGRAQRSTFRGTGLNEWGAGSGIGEGIQAEDERLIFQSGDSIHGVPMYSQE
jgi:hypothetical protein